MTETLSHKAACRAASAQARELAHAEGLDAKANAQLLNHLKERPKHAVIAGYMPIGTEVSPLIAMKKLHASGYKICVPVVIKKGAPLVFYEWSPEIELVRGEFGVLVPKEPEILVPDIVITPLLAFDTYGYRLGYGGGFYDRTLGQLERDRGVFAIGYAYSDQEVMIVPREETDHKLDMIITEKGMMKV